MIGFHVVTFNQSSSYTIQGFMFMDGDGEITCTLFGMCDVCGWGGNSDH
jgi:hypothetical protein